tara:strand:- start:597 stop:797 length:201 start_codon:yes stop_codon:yes gene_type:complete
MGIKAFLLVISMWGNNGTEWVYVGNQIVLNYPMPKEQCMAMAKDWSWHEQNEYYRFSIECHEDKNV